MDIGFTRKNWITFFIGVAAILIGKFLSPISALTDSGNTALFFMVALVVFIATETFPTGMIAIIAIVFLPILGLTSSLNAAAVLFGNQLFFYTLSCYAISIIMEKLPLSKRILLFFLKRFGKSTKGLIGAMLLSTVVMSTFISNFPAALLTLMVAKQYIAMIDDEQQKKKTQRSLMTGIIVSVAIGGIVTPAGSSSMALASTYLQETGYTVTFLQWMVFGLPIAIVWFPIALFILFKFLPPPEMDSETRLQFIAKIKESVPDKLSKKEIFTIVILGLTFVCWILNYNLMLVTCCCCLALIFPGFRLMSWKELSKGAGWGTVMILCSLTAVVTVLQDTGVVDWLLSLLTAIFPDTGESFVLLLILGLCTALMLMLIPSAPVLVTVIGSSMVQFALQLGYSPVIFVMGFAFFATFGCIFPIDTLSVVIYDEGKNFEAKDRIITAIPITIIATIITAIWMPICCRILNL